MRLIGRGRDDGATDSILSTVALSTKAWIFYQEDFRFNDTGTGCLAIVHRMEAIGMSLDGAANANMHLGI